PGKCCNRLSGLAAGIDDAPYRTDHAGLGLLALDQQAGIEPALRGKLIFDRPRPEIDADLAAIVRARLQRVLGVFGLVAAMEGADADMGEADPRLFAIVTRPADTCRRVRKIFRAEPLHASLGPTTHCSWSISEPVIGSDAGDSRKCAS